MQLDLTLRAVDSEFAAVLPSPGEDRWRVSCGLTPECHVLPLRGGHVLRGQDDARGHCRGKSGKMSQKVEAKNNRKSQKVERETYCFSKIPWGKGMMALSL